MTNENKFAQIKSLISQIANEASESELSVLLEIAILASIEYNRVQLMDSSTTIHNGNQIHRRQGFPQSSTNG